MALNAQVQTFCDKGIAVPTQHAPGEFISNIFHPPKPNGDVRFILDLTLFNNCIEYKHFNGFDYAGGLVSYCRSERRLLYDTDNTRTLEIFAFLLEQTAL